MEKEGQFEEANSLVKSLIQDLFRDKDYQEIVSVLNSDLCEEKELFYNFEVAYALNEVGNVDQAEVVYETILVWDENNSAVLNNLSNIKKAKGKIKEAFDLIQKAKNLEPNDDIINRNYENLLNIINEQAAIEQNYKNAIKFVQNENEFVINKLANFLFNIKKDKVFKNNRIPIPNWKFKVLMGTDEQKAESLKKQWLEKGYIRKTGERFDNFIAIYEINPYLNDALQRVQNIKINKKWIDGFENVNVQNLEKIGYFEILSKIRQINKKYKSLIERDFNELVINYLMKNEKAVIVLAGSLIEVLLLYYCEKKRIKKVSYQRQNKTIQKDLYDCDLGDLLSYFEQTKTMGNLIVHLGNISRIYRNFIHPGKELREIETLNQSKLDLCSISAIEIIKKVI